MGLCHGSPFEWVKLCFSKEKYVFYVLSAHVILLGSTPTHIFGDGHELGFKRYTITPVLKKVCYKYTLVNYSKKLVRTIYFFLIWAIYIIFWCVKFCKTIRAFDRFYNTFLLFQLCWVMWIQQKNPNLYPPHRKKLQKKISNLVG